MTAPPDEAHILGIHSWQGFGGIHFYGQVTPWTAAGPGDDIDLTRPVTAEFLDTLPDDERRSYRSGRETARFDTKAEVIAAAERWMTTNAPASVLYLHFDWIRQSPEPIWDGRPGSELPTEPVADLEVAADAPTPTQSGL